MARTWFKPMGWLYRPVSWQAVAILLAAMAFCVRVFLAVDRHSHSASDTLYGIFPYVACVFLLVDRIARRSSTASV